MSLLLTSLMTLELIVMQNSETVSQFQSGQYRLDTPQASLALDYRLLSPEKLEPGARYPVVLFLHGAGERGADNQKQLLYLPELMAGPEMRRKYPCFLIAPQCPEGKKWVEVPWEANESTPLAAPTPQVSAVMGLLNKVLEKHPADRRRVYLTGLSMGGYGVWDLAVRHPEWFAAVAPICAGGDETKAARLKDTPLWAFHGDADKTVPVVRSRRMIEAIRQAGGKPKYTELPGIGHNSWNPAYNDPAGLIPWMFEQARDNGDR